MKSDATLNNSLYQGSIFLGPDFLYSHSGGGRSIIMRSDHHLSLIMHWVYRPSYIFYWIGSWSATKNNWNLWNKYNYLITYQVPIGVTHPTQPGLPAFRFSGTFWVSFSFLQRLARLVALRAAYSCAILVFSRFCDIIWLNWGLGVHLDNYIYFKNFNYFDVHFF